MSARAPALHGPVILVWIAAGILAWTAIIGLAEAVRCLLWMFWGIG